MKDYNVMINEKNSFDQPVKNTKRRHESISIATPHGDYYTMGC